MIDWHDGRQGDRRKKLGSLRFQPFNAEVADLDLIIEDLSENGHKVIGLFLDPRSSQAVGGLFFFRPKMAEIFCTCAQEEYAIPVYGSRRFDRLKNKHGIKKLPGNAKIPG